MKNIDSILYPFFPSKIECQAIAFLHSLSKIQDEPTQHCPSIVPPLYYRCTSIVLPLYHHYTSIVLALYHRCTTIVPPLYHHCTTTILPLYTSIIPALYHHDWHAFHQVNKLFLKSVLFSTGIKCKGGAIYDDCGPACRLTCHNKDDANKVCTKPCVAGCQCPAGKVWHKKKCISPNKCPK